LVDPYARIVHINNSVRPLEWQGQNILFAILAFVVGIGLIYYFPKVSPEDWTLRIAMAFNWEARGAILLTVERRQGNGFYLGWDFCGF